MSLNITEHRGLQTRQPIANLQDLANPIDNLSLNSTVGDIIVTSLDSSISVTEKRTERFDWGYFEYEPEGFDWIRFVPVIVFATILLSVTSFVYWHDWKSQRRCHGRLGNISIRFFSKNLLQGSKDSSHDLRSSTCSTTTLKTNITDTTEETPLPRTVDDIYPINNNNISKYGYLPQKVSHIDEIHTPNETTTQALYSPNLAIRATSRVRNEMPNGTFPTTPHNGYNNLTPAPHGSGYKTPAVTGNKNGGWLSSQKRNPRQSPYVFSDIVITAMLMNDQLYEIARTSTFSTPSPRHGSSLERICTPGQAASTSNRTPSLSKQSPGITSLRINDVRDRGNLKDNVSPEHQDHFGNTNYRSNSGQQGRCLLDISESFASEADHSPVTAAITNDDIGDVYDAHLTLQSANHLSHSDPNIAWSCAESSLSSELRTATSQQRHAKFDNAHVLRAKQYSLYWL